MSVTKTAVIMRSQSSHRIKIEAFMNANRCWKFI